MPRGTSRASKVFGAVLESAAKRLHLAGNEAEAFKQTVVRGDERAAALAEFLREHLPASIGVSKGEAIDHLDNRTGQLDIIIYDADMAAPISAGSENVLVPAESLLAVIEVKTTLSQAELHKCYAAASKVRRLKPFKHAFVAPRADGLAAEDGNFRCLYAVFAYETNLSDTSWMEKEFARIDLAAKATVDGANLVDLVYILSRGMIRPAKQAAKENNTNRLDMFLEFYLHIVNFLRREMPRRPAMDWQAYTAKTSPGWTVLKSPPAS